jgi:hypothetical protein
MGLSSFWLISECSLLATIRLGHLAGPDLFAFAP